ncbi:hypothetical protein FKW77_010791 [Venturia effusa]|uniref:Zn(2)-C6 fungal-type domain-containing protein n=1 Tax=Venturia effusa TaxID=50376 RepID=A0A517KYG6_9PEZI|nr:hypothetical protein FKW77_010791 [Venturia effusa]
MNAESTNSRVDLSNTINPTVMGQAQSGQNPSFKSEMGLAKCFHKSGSAEADVPLLDGNNVWMGEELAQPQDEKVPPIKLGAFEQSFDEPIYGNQLFYCEGCCDGGSLGSWTGGYVTRSVTKDDQKIRFVDAQCDGKHHTFAIQMLHCRQDTKNVRFGFVNKDGSVHPDFRLLTAGPLPIIFPAQGSEKLVLRPSSASAVSEKERKAQGLRDSLPTTELDTKLRDIDKLSRKQDDHFARQQSLGLPVTTSIIDTIEPAGVTARAEGIEELSVRHPIVSSVPNTPTRIPPFQNRTPITRNGDDDRRGISPSQIQPLRHGNARGLPSYIPADHPRSISHFDQSFQQKSHAIAQASIALTKTAPAPLGSHLNGKNNVADRPIWYQNDAHGTDMGENMVFGDTPLRIYPIGLPALSRPAWFCPDPSCNRHFNARRAGSEPFQNASALREHAIIAHPPKPLPSSSSLPPPPRTIRSHEVESDVLRDGFTTAESARVGPTSARRTATRPSPGLVPAKAIPPVIAPRDTETPLTSLTSNARLREETDSLLGSDDDENSDDAAASSPNFNVPKNVSPTAAAYLSPYATMPNSASPVNSAPRLFAEPVQSYSMNNMPRRKSRHNWQSRAGGRACSSCKARKAKCGKERPACSFCAKKGLPCDYPGEGETTSNSYDSPSEPDHRAAPHPAYSNIGLQERGGERAVRNDHDHDDDDEEKLLAEIEAMEKEEMLKQQQRRSEEEEFTRIAEEKRKRLAEEANRAEYEKERVKRESVQRLKAEKLRRKAAIAEAEREYEAKREAQKRKYEEEHDELLRKKQKADEERQQS